jgi:small redox-active disulfide protein 2
MLIEVFGPGCAKCHRSAATAREFLERHGIDGEVVEHADIDVMIARGVLRTPTVFVDGRKIVEGRRLREADVEACVGGSEG